MRHNEKKFDYSDELIGDIRVNNLYYLLKNSKALMKGPIHHDGWHRYGGSHKRRETKYKNINRTTIKKLKLKE